MTQITSFNPIKTDIEDILSEIDKAKLQLPDFQRSWIWDDASVVSRI